MESKPGIERLPSFDGWKPDRHANYSGSDRKSGLIDPDGSRHMVKYSEKQAPRNDLATSYVNNVVSEYVSSHILGILGYPVHETELGTLGGEVVVVCRNFVPPGGDLIEFGTFMRRHYDSHDIGRVPDIRQIYEIIETDPDLSPQAERFKACYWERFVGDALVGNFDRHKGNFGYLIGADDSVAASPVYDNGSTLYPNLSEEGMRAVLGDPKEIMMRVKLFPKAALEMQGKKVGYYDMMASGIYGELTEAVVSAVPRIRDRMPAVCEFIDGCNFLSDTRRDFYKIMLAERMAFVLEPAYEKYVSRQFDQEARKRLEAGADYSMEDFERYWDRDGSSDGKAAANIRDAAMNAVFGGRVAEAAPVKASFSDLLARAAGSASAAKAGHETAGSVAAPVDALVQGAAPAEGLSRAELLERKAREQKRKAQEHESGGIYQPKGGTEVSESAKRIHGGDRTADEPAAGAEREDDFPKP